MEKLVIENGVISGKTSGEVIVDGGGGTEAGIDILTHLPFTAALSRALVKKIAAKNIVSVPTIYTMKGIVEMIKKKVPLIPFSYKKIQKNMARMHKYGIPFLAGTDANMHDPTTPVSAPYGVSFLEELVLMADCGLTPIEVLRSATSIPAEYWSLKDRGIIKAGNRAELVLVDDCPVKDIHAIKNIKQVWVAGKPV
jgi:imidazolonepropionase-like amidohydrolase